jgi:tyrosyl-tRNA synthetase
MAAKKELAHYLVAEYHDEAAAEQAATEFEKVFSGGGVPDEVPLIALAGPSQLPDVLMAADLAPSKREARRLIQQGAVSIDNERASDPTFEITAREEPYLFKVGKRRFARIRIE